MQDISHSEPSQSRVTSSINSRTAASSSFDDEKNTFQRRENLIFPLFSEMSRNVKIPFFLYIFSQILSLFQFLVSGLWTNSSHFWVKEREDNDAIRIFQCFIDSGLHELNGIDSIVTYIIYIVFFVIFVGWHAYVIAYYHNIHQFSKPMLYLTQVLQQFLLPPVLPFYASHAGQAFSRVAEEVMSEGGVSIQYSLFFVFFSIATIILFTFFSYCFCFLCRSPILPKILDASWDPKPVILMLFIMCYRCFFSCVLDHFEPWVNMIFILASAALTVYVIFKLRDFPFHQFWANSAFAGLSIGHIFFEVLLIPSCFSHPVPTVIYVILSLISITISIVVSYFYLRQKRRKIIQQMSYSAIGGNSDISDTEKKIYFESLKLKTESDIYSFLRIGLIYNCDLFLDFSFPHFVVDNYSSQKLVLSVAQMISFFPSEFQYLSYCLNMIWQMGELSFHDHFLFFQMKKVNMMRQSSLSKESSTTIRKMKKQSIDAISAIRGFWKEVASGHVNLDFNSVIAVQKTTNNLKGMFQYLSEKFSNSQEMCNVYAMFLIEGAGEFKEALQWKMKAVQLERGKRLDTDFSLRSLFNTYPHYLLDRIIDEKGKFINTKKDLSASGSTSELSSETNSIDDDVFFQKMDDFSTNLITESKLRLSVENSLEKASIPGLSTSKYMFLIQFIVVVLIFIVILAWVPTLNKSINDIITEVQNMAYVYLHTGYTSWSAAHLLTMHPDCDTFGGYNVVKEKSNFPVEKMETKKHSVLYKIYDHISLYLNYGVNSFNLLNQGLMKHPTERLDALEFYLYSNITLYSAESSKISKKKNMTVSTRSAVLNCFTYLLQAIENYQSGKENDTETANLLLTGVYNMVRLSPNLESALYQLTEIGDSMVKSKKDLVVVLEIAIPVVYAIVFLILQIRTICVLYKKTNSTLDILRKVKPDVIEDSLDPIMIGTKEKKINSSSSQLRTSRSFAYTVLPAFCVISIITNAVILFLTFFMGLREMNQVSGLFNWYDLTSTRIGAIFHTMSSLAYITYGSKETVNEFKEYFKIFYDQIQETHTALLGGNDKVSRLIGFDDNIDTLHFIDVCDTDPINYYDFYLCLSIDRAINEMQIFLKRLNHSMGNNNFTLEDSHYTDAIILLDYRLAQAMFNFQNSMTDYMTKEFHDVASIMTTFSVIGILVSVVVFVLSFFFIRSFDVALNGICQLIRLLPPSQMLKSNRLMEFVVSISSKDDESTLTPSQSIVLASPHASISISLDYTINSVNPSFKDITGLTPEEVIGQPLSILFPFPTGGSSSSSSNENSSLQVLYDRLGSMKNNEIQSNCEKLVMKCTNEIGKPLHIEVTLIPIKNEKKETQSFVLSLKDINAQKQEKMAAKNSKKRSEKILQNILPASVFDSMKKNPNKEETSTLYVSDAATIITVQIVGLLDCVSWLSPSQLIQVMQKINETFDEIVSKYPIVHLINSQDDIIVACCGLFDYMNQPKDQVQQAVIFALELNSLTDELNEQLAVELKFRIGINHGGPLAGNVLDEKTPKFDLIGKEVLSPAFALATDGEAGVVKVTEYTFNLLDVNEYEFSKENVINVSETGQQIQIYYITNLVI